MIFKKLFFLLGVTILSLSQFPASVMAESKLVGITALEQLDKLPYLKTGVRAKQVSSYDRAGGNEDGFNGYYSSLYRDSTGHVIFDEIGAGTVYLIWFTAHRQELKDMGNIRFYFDNETTPRIDMRVVDFFSGIREPFLFPLAGNDNIINNLNSIGGLYSYIPLPFAKGLKISISGATPRFYHITYHLYDDNQGVVSFTGRENYTQIKQIWANTGKDPKLTTGNLTLKGSKTLALGQTETLAEIVGEGVIQSIKIKPSSFSATALNLTKLKIKWDNRPDFGVDVGLGPFFGSSFGQLNYNSIMLGVSDSNYYYSYFPMPFWSHAEIRVENKSGSAIKLDYEIQYQKTRYPDDSGYFYAQYNQATPTDTNDYPVLTTTGKGHFVGMSASMKADSLLFLEGDERVYLDNNPSPALSGTGTEDYFNSGWYFKNGPFSLASHGNPKRGYSDIVAYRLHLGDSLPFTQAIKFGLEHGPTNSYNANYYTVAYYYKKDEPSLIKTDELDVKNTNSETAHQYSITGQTGSEINIFSYEDGNVVSDGGRSFSGSSQFVVSIKPDNQGIRLTRRTDFKTTNQKAKVYADGVLVGTWYSAGANPHLRWRNEDFEIPSLYTQGKKNITIKIQSLSDWNEYYYWVSSHVSGQPAIPTPTRAPLLGDFDADNHITIADYLILVANYGTANTIYDLNKSGLVDSEDFQILMINYGK